MSHPFEAHASQGALLAEDGRYSQLIVSTCTELGLTTVQASSLAERSIENRRKLRL